MPRREELAGTRSPAVTDFRSAEAAADERLTDELSILVINWLDRENPLAGGAETHLHEVFGRLATRGHDVVALVSGWRGCAPRTTLDRMEVHRSGRRYSFSFTAPRYYRSHLASCGFDVVVEDLNKVPVFSPLWAGAPVVLFTHHLFGATAFQAAPAPVAVATWLLERPIPRVFRNTPTIAVSDSTKEDLIVRGMSADLIEVIPNGIDVAHYAPDPSVRSFERPTVVFLGRLKKYKRVDLVVEAVAVLAREGIDLELVIAGDGEELEPLRAQASSLGIEERVQILGFVDEERKLEVLRRAWVHVLTSPKEGWGIANLEAAACGTPSVVSDSPGLRDSVLHGKTGLLVPHGDVAALAAALGTVLRDDELRAHMSLAARAFAERFSWGAAADAVERALRRVVVESGHH